MKKMALQEEEALQQLHSPASASVLLDGLYCEEESFDEDFAGLDSINNNNDINHNNAAASEILDPNVKKESSLPFSLLEQDLFWEDDELLSLISKEKETHFSFDNVVSDGLLMVARREAIEWIFRVKAHHGFTALTTVLAVNYFDRFISGVKLQRENPWMGQLVAVVCMSLAAKVEETHLPLLVDLQVDESKYMFEAKTIKRMELMVLSNLQWRMNPVTPISFFDHIMRRLGLKTHLHWEFMWKCERLLLSVIADSRFMGYLPSILAAAIMLHVIEKVEPCNQLEYQRQLIGVLKVSKNRVRECYKLMSELPVIQNLSRKRKQPSTPSSPSGVIDAFFNSDSSNDSWTVTSSISSSPLPQFKRSRAQDQQMRLSSLNHMIVDALSSPR